MNIIGNNRIKIESESLKCCRILSLPNNYKLLIHKQQFYQNQLFQQITIPYENDDQ